MSKKITASLIIFTFFAAFGISLVIQQALGVSVGGNLDMGSHQIKNLSDPTANTDAATKGYVDSVAGGWTVINKVSAASDVASLNISGIPSGYRFLRLTGHIAKTGGTWHVLGLVFNNDTGTNYDCRPYYGLWGQAVSYVGGYDSSLLGIAMTQNEDEWSIGQIIISNKADLDKAVQGFFSFNYLEQSMIQGMWKNKVSEINSISLRPYNSGDGFIKSGSFLLLEGIK